MQRDASAITRRRFMVGAGATVALVACGPGRDASSPSPVPAGKLPAMPKQPVSITITDPAGQKQLMGAAIEDYAKQHSQYVSEVVWDKILAPDLAPKLKTEEAAGVIQHAMVLTGGDGLAFGIAQGVFEPLLPNYAAKFPNLTQNYVEPKAQELAQGFGILDVFGNWGPTFTYDPKKVDIKVSSQAVATTDDLLAWAKAHPNQLIYAQPKNSGPGRAFLQGLPYLLKDSDPKNPDTWTNTWAYMAELGKYIESYPGGTGATMQQLGKGQRLMAASTFGWDMNVRTDAQAIVPRDFKCFSLGHLVADAQYIVVPKGLDSDRLAVVLDMIAWMLKPDQQAKSYDDGYFYPGPAVKGVTLDMAPAASQKSNQSVARPEFDAQLKSLAKETPLDGNAFVKAVTLWEQKVAALKTK